MTIKSELDKAQRDMERDAAQNRQPGPGTPPKMDFPFDLQSRRPKDTPGISGNVNTSKKP